MTNVYSYGTANLCYCSAEEYENIKNSGLKVSALLCAKNPYHKEIVGYERNCEKNNPEYLVAYRPEENIMALNMVDANSPEYFSDEMVLAGLDFIHCELATGNDVVVVCNKGESRSPTMCLMYMMVHGDFDKTLSHSEVFVEFSKKARNWHPKNGILQYCVGIWNEIKKGGILCEDLLIQTEGLK